MEQLDKANKVKPSKKVDQAKGREFGLFACEKQDFLKGNPFRPKGESQIPA